MSKWWRMNTCKLEYCTIIPRVGWKDSFEMRDPGCVKLSIEYIYIYIYIYIYTYIYNCTVYISSSPSIGTATLVGYGLLNYRWVFPGGRFLQNAVGQRHVKPPNLEDQWLERSNSRLKWRERTLAAEGGTKGEKLPRILPKVATFTSLLGSFTCRKFTTWDRRLYFPSEERRAEDLFARKIRGFRPGLNPRTWVRKASTFTSRPPKPLFIYLTL